MVDHWKNYIDPNLDVYVRAPGRINLIGEHTDYNMGYALPAAIDKYIYFGFKANGKSIFQIEAKNYKQTYSGKLGTLLHSEFHWANYLIAVIQQIEKRNLAIRGFDVQIYGTIPIGSGLSSSAAIECGMAKGLSALFNLNLQNWDLVDIGNKAEHELIGVKSGILDQFASVFGKSDQAMILNCRNRSFKYVPLHLGDNGFVVINSMVKHSHTTSGYLDRVSECKRAVDFFNRKFGHVHSLRDANMEMLKASRSEMEPVIYNRASYIIAENQRVLDFKQAFDAKDFSKAGNILNTCHEGLSERYQVSCPELDFLAKSAREHYACLGARMMGGGFGGCTLNLIQKIYTEEFSDHLRNNFIKSWNIDPEIYKLGVVDGVTTISYDE